jgi:hypothetical protein
LNVKLDERSGQFLIFPRRSRLAGTQPHDGVVHADGLTGFQGNIADNAVALVEQAQNRDALSHRRNPGLLARPRIRRRQPGAICLLLGLIVAPAPRQKQQCNAGNGKGPHVSPASRADNRRLPRAASFLWTRSRPVGRQPWFP